MSEYKPKCSCETVELKPFGRGFPELYPDCGFETNGSAFYSDGPGPSHSVNRCTYVSKADCDQTKEITVCVCCDAGTTTPTDDFHDVRYDSKGNPMCAKCFYTKYPNLLCNGHIYGSFEYGETFYTIGPINACDFNELVVHDNQFGDCSTAIEIEAPDCCEANEDCNISHHHPTRTYNH